MTAIYIVLAIIIIIIIISRCPYEGLRTLRMSCTDQLAEAHRMMHNHTRLIRALTIATVSKSEPMIVERIRDSLERNAQNLAMFISLVRGVPPSVTRPNFANMASGVSRMINAAISAPSDWQNDADKYHSIIDMYGYAPYEFLLNQDDMWQYLFHILAMIGDIVGRRPDDHSHRTAEWLANRIANELVSCQ